MKNRYFIELSFKGTQYHGWQVQPNAVTVQELLDKTLQVLLKEETETTGAGRTDSGVHAPYFVAHFDSMHDNLHQEKELLRKLNQMLPKDISILALTKMHPEAHARFDALSRTYEYRISLAKDPFLLDSAHYMHDNLDVDLMNKGAAIINTTTDFTSFSKLHTDVKTNVCAVRYSQWDRRDHVLVYTICADRFLRNMVRAITGTLLDLGRGKISMEQLEQIIQSKNRNLAGNSVPSQRLFLTDIEYPASSYLSRMRYKSY